MFSFLQCIILEPISYSEFILAFTKLATGDNGNQNCSLLLAV